MNREQTLPLEKNDIERLKDIYGKNLLNVIYKVISGIKKGIIFLFLLILSIEIIIFVANIDKKSNQELQEMLVSMIWINVFVTVFGFIIFFLLGAPRNIIKYLQMQQVITKNTKLRIIGKATLESIMDSEGSYSNYWEVQTTGNDSLKYSFSELNCSDGDIVIVDFVRIGSRNIVLSLKQASNNANHADGLEKENSFRILFEQGAKKFNQGMYAEAIKYFTHAIDLNPKNGAMYHNRAISKVEIKDYNGAMVDFTRAIQLEPDNAYFYEGRGNLKRRLKEYYSALDDYEKASKLEPDLNTVYYHKSRIYALLGQRDNALFNLRKALEKGFDTIKSLERNPDFDSIRHMNEFKNLVNEFRS